MTTTIELTSSSQAPKIVLSRIVSAGMLSMLAATAANLGLYYAAGILFPEVTAWPGAGPAQIAGANFVYLLIGAIAFTVIARISSKPALHYLILATVGLLLSFGLPIAAGFGYAAPGAPPASIATVITLSLMHVVSYAISVPLFTRLALD
jgi:hypothetical protein